VWSDLIIFSSPLIYQYLRFCKEEADTVAHCGDSVEGFYLNTLMAVDVASGWAEGSVVWGKSQERVGSAIHGIRRRFPFPILGLDTDNGGEFISQHLFSYCRREHITFTRSRSYKKNDNCYVEQKNGNVVRRVIGYLKPNLVIVDDFAMKEFTKLRPKTCMN